jgi:hypothetical protein
VVRREVLERAAAGLLREAVALEAVLLDDRPLLLPRRRLRMAVPNERAGARRAYDTEKSDGDDELARDGRTPFSVAMRSAGDRDCDHSSI